MDALARRPVVNLLAGADATAELVSQRLMGETVEVIEADGEWRRVRGRDDYEGWAAAADLTLPSDDWDGNARARVSAIYANLRAAPSRRCGPVACVSIGTTLPVADREEEWLGLRLPCGGIGWIEEFRSESPDARPADPAAVLATARQFLGVPYLWGGVSGFGIDCSGLVQAVFGMHGVALPRDAHQQAAVGTPIEREGLARGDTVFFGAPPGAPAERITHVALAIDPGRILHAFGGDGMVVESPLAAGGTFWGARRALGQDGSG